MAITAVTPVASSILDPGDSFSFTIDNTYTVLQVEVDTQSGVEYAYDDALGGAQAGYTVTVTPSGGQNIFVISRDAGWDTDPQTLRVIEDEAGGSPVTTGISYFLSTTQLYPEGHRPYNAESEGILSVTEDDVAIRTDVGILDFDNATFNVTDMGSGKVRVVGIAVGSGLTIEDEGTPLTTGATKINFVGGGVTATEPVANEIDVTIPNDHGGLAGLGDDDHTLYYRTNAQRTFEAAFFAERADHVNTPGILNGELWLRNDAIQQLVFTDEAGTDYEIQDTSGTRDQDASFFAERADHVNTPAAGFGELWVRNDTPNVLVFTDDAGTDTVLGGGGATDHGTLTGLGDDDHTQYYLGAGTRTMECAFLAERADHVNTPGILNAELWVKNDAVQQLKFTDEAGTDYDIQDTSGTRANLASYFSERADHVNTPAATFGELWVRNDTPNVLVFTDDAGTDTVLGAGGGPEVNDLATDGIQGIADDQIAIGSGAGTAAYATLPNGAVTYATATNTLSQADLADLGDVTAKTGSGTTVVMDTSPTIVTPTIASFTNATHDHQAAAGGGQLDHGLSLTGLTDDDHTQYVLNAGTRNQDAAYFSERADHVNTPAATFGELWVRNDTPNVLVFTDDAGTDTVLGQGVPTSRTLTAGAGLTGGGDLSADRTFNVIANVDGSITVNADDIQVGVLATDAQHGNRGGGSLHALAIAGGAAGFLSGTDKTKLDNTSGTNTGDQTITLTGDVTGSGTGSFAATISANAVTNAKAADMAGFTVKAKPTTGAGDPSDLSVGTNTVVGRVAGDIVAAQLTNAQIANSTITNAKHAVMAANTIRANPTASSTNPSDLAVGTNTVVGRVAGNIVAAQVATGQIADNAVTYAKMQDVSATSRFLGRITGGAGDPEELTGTQATTLLDTFTSGLKGLAPASGGGTTNFLRADGTWAAPAGDVTGGSASAVGEIATYTDTSGKVIGRSDIKIGSATPTVGTRTLGTNSTMVGGWISGSGASIISNGSGTIALGGAQQLISSTCKIEALSTGSVALGYVNATGSIANMIANGNGACTIGAATSSFSSTTTMQVTTTGGFAGGSALQGGTIECVSGSNGSFAHGIANNSGVIRCTTGVGAFAVGSADGSGSTIISSGAGSFSTGRAASGGDIAASGAGAFAGGDATTNAITASAAGAFAWGDASGASITASASNAVQFGEGTNSTADSLQVGGNFIAKAAGAYAGARKTITLGAGATTFAIDSTSIQVTGDAGANTISTITGGTAGQFLALQFVDSLVTLTDTAAATANTMNLAGGFTSTANDIVFLFYDGNKWFEVSRSVN